LVRRGKYYPEDWHFAPADIVHAFGCQIYLPLEDGQPLHMKYRGGCSGIGKKLDCPPVPSVDAYGFIGGQQRQPLTIKSSCGTIKRVFM
jgi:hypothetical protein